MPHSAHLLAKSPVVGEESAIQEESSAGENAPNGTANDTVDLGGKGKKRKRKRALKANSGSTARRRLSVSKPARDPRDEAAASLLEPLTETRSPSPVIDFDGLSRPSMSQRSKRVLRHSNNNWQAEEPESDARKPLSKQLPDWKR